MSQETQQLFSVLKKRLLLLNSSRMSLNAEILSWLICPSLRNLSKELGQRTKILLGEVSICLLFPKRPVAVEGQINKNVVRRSAFNRI